MSDRPTAAYLRAAALRLHRLVRLRAALASFRAALPADGGDAEDRRRLLTLWRPCQEGVDLLLEAFPATFPDAIRMHLLRHEVEGHLLDEAYSRAALVEAVGALEQVCEVLLVKVERSLREAVEGLDVPPGGGDLL